MKNLTVTIILIMLITMSTSKVGIALATKEIVHKLYTAPDSTIVKTDTLLINAIEHLKSYEGFRSTVYLDTDGSPTIGYGHHLLSGETYSNITEIEATSILMSDFTLRQVYIEDLYQIKGSKLIALTLFSFNLGTGNLKKAITNGLLSNPNIILQYCHYRTYNDTGEATIHTSHKLLQRRQYELRLLNL